MKTTKIAVAAMAVLCAVLSTSSCKKAGKEVEPAQEPETVFTVSLNTVEAEYAEMVVRHTGAKDVTWFGFVTEDVTSSEETLINAQVSHLNKKSLHVGNAQTVAVRNLKETEQYRYIAFAVNSDNEVFGKPGSIVFSTSPNLKVVFTAEATEVKYNEASFTVGHAGYAELTYTCFVTTDLKKDVKTLAAEDFAANVKDGVLNEDVTLISGNSVTVTIDELTAETKYRFVVYGIFENNGVYEYYGTPAECTFETPLNLANVQFAGATANVTKFSAEVKVTYNAKSDDLTWYGFLTDDATTEVSALIAANVTGVSAEDYQKGPKTVTLTNLTPDTEYRYIVTGINADGVYGIPADVKFTAEDNDLVLAYEDFIGEWKVNGVAFDVSAKETGSTYTIEGFPGTSGARGGVTTIVASYDSQLGVLTVEDQDLGSYNDPSDNNYGPLKDFFAGSVMTTMSSGSQQYWPVYPFQSDDKKPIFKFVGAKDGTFELRPVGDVEAVSCGWVILTGSNKGLGNVYGSAVTLPVAVTKVDKLPAAYGDFLGSWNFGSQVITIAQKTAGSTYTVSGFYKQSDIYGDNHVVVGNYDAQKKEFYVMEQKLGAFNTADIPSFGENQYGDCDDYLSGYFPYGSGGFFAYPFNTNAPSRIFTAFLNSKGEMEVIAGSCAYGNFTSLDFIWVIRSGEDAGGGNNYSYPDHGTAIPAVMTKASGTASVSSVHGGKTSVAPKVGNTSAPLISIAK